jgi:hypothetical protein
MFFGDLGKARAEEELGKVIEDMEARTEGMGNMSSPVTGSGDSAPTQVLAMSNA